MAGKAKWLLMLALVLALGGFALFVLTRGGTRYATFQEFPDGSVLRLGGVAMTNGFHSYRANSVSGWRAKLMDVLPKRWTTRFGWIQMGGSMTVGSSAIGPSLGTFTMYDGTNNGFVFTRLVVFDELGNSFDAGNAMGTMATSDGKHMMRADAWLPPAFPRRGRTLGFRYFEKKTTNWQQVAEFAVPNPAPGDYPTWTAESLPATKSDGDLSVTLARLKSGMSKGDRTKPAGSNEIAVTEAVLRVTQANHATNAWRPIAVEISDATSNHWKPFPHIISVKREGDADDFSFNGALWAGESAWKMKFELSRVADFEPDEVCTFNGILVPGATQVIDLGNTTNIGGSKLQLKAISGNKAEQPGNLKWSTVKNRVNISIRVDPMPSDRRLTLLKVVDENGREAEITREPDWNSPERVYGFKAPEGAKQLSFTFAFHKSRFVEFLARPEFARAN